MKIVKETKLGRIGIEECDGHIVALNLNDGGVSCNGRSALIEKAFKQLEEYLDGRRKAFDLPLNPKGTEFQKKVWAALLKIKYGKTASYKDIAVAIGNPKACRAVGMANNRNPIAIFIPCHRIIGANGALVGYGGGLGIKKTLLDMEKSAKL